MYTSAVIQGIRNKSLPVSFRFEWAANDDEAFINEYIWMVQYGYSSKNQNFSIRFGHLVDYIIVQEKVNYIQGIIGEGRKDNL